MKAGPGNWELVRDHTGQLTFILDALTRAPKCSTRLEAGTFDKLVRSNHETFGITLRAETFVSPKIILFVSQGHHQCWFLAERVPK